MKKVLGLLGTILTGTPLALTTVACNQSAPISPTYNSIADGIKSLKIKSFTKPAEQLGSVVNGIGTDIMIGIIKLNFAKGVTFDDTKFNVSAENIINIATNQPLTATDLANSQTLNLKVNVTYDNVTNIPVKSVTLNVLNQTNQEISDYIKNYDFSGIFLSNNFLPVLFTYWKVADFKDKLTNLMLQSLGSFVLCFDVNKLTWNTLKKDSNVLTDNDLKTLGKLSFTINYNYLDIAPQDINLSVNLNKYNLANDATPLLTDLTVNLGAGQDPSKLTQTDVEKIITEIKNSAMTSLNNFYQTSFSGQLTQESDIDILGFSEVTINADFSSPVTVNYTVNAKLNSILVTKSLPNQTVNVTATAT